MFFFDTQISLVKNVLTNNCYVMGDFNLDARMDMRPDYDHKVPLSCLTNFALENNLVQIVTGTTWSRVINGVKKESLLDHVYVKNAASVLNMSLKKPIFGDHSLVLVEIIIKPQLGSNVTTTRNWKSYVPLNAKTMLTFDMAGIDDQCLNMSVQDHWNVLENILINVIDSLAPLFTLSVKLKSNKNVVPRNVKQKMNRRKRLIRAVNAYF